MSAGVYGLRGPCTCCARVAVTVVLESSLAHLVKLTRGKPYNTDIPPVGLNLKYIF